MFIGQHLLSYACENPCEPSVSTCPKSKKTCPEHVKNLPRSMETLPRVRERHSLAIGFVAAARGRASQGLGDLAARPRQGIRTLGEPCRDFGTNFCAETESSVHLGAEKFGENETKNYKNCNNVHILFPPICALRNKCVYLHRNIQYTLNYNFSYEKVFPECCAGIVRRL